MANLEELKKTKRRIQAELKKPPHERDGRLFRHRTPRQRLRDLEQKIERKKEKKRRRETRRKLLLGAGLKTYIEAEDLTFQEVFDQAGWTAELGEDYPALFPGVFDANEDPGENAQERRMIVLGGLVMRDRDPDEWTSFLERVLPEDDDDWLLFNEVDEFPGPDQ